MRRIDHFFLSAIFFAVMFTSCKKDLVTPPAPVDGLTAVSGRNRAKVEFKVPEGAIKGKVFYGNGEYKTFDIKGSTQTVIVDGLKEQDQVLRVVTINAEGATSDPKAVEVSVYGDNYEQALKPRKWKDQIIGSSGDIELVFDTAFSGETAVRVVYENTSGAQDSIDMPASEQKVIIKSINTKKDYFYYSIYKPESTAIDSFFSTRLSVKAAMMMDFQKEKWILDAASGQDGQNDAANIIDNNSNTSWRTAQGAALPQWVTVDMGNPKVIDGFYYVKTPENNNDGPKGLKIEVSQDKVSWSKVLEADVTESYLRQQLSLEKSVTARYFRITATSSVNPEASQVEFAEIDAYNSLNLSGINGYTQASPIALKNAKMPFTGDGSDLLPLVGAGRMQKVADWVHNSNVNISYDNATKAMNPFSAAVWGAPEVMNGKIHQTVTLEPGKYLLKIESGATEGPVEIFGVAVSGSSLPDYNAVASSSSTIKYANLMDYQNKTVEMLLTITKASPVSIGIVFNLPDRYPSTGIAWTHFTIKGFDLQKLD